MGSLEAEGKGKARRQLNVELPEDLYVDVKAKAVDLGVKVGRFVQGLLAVGLYISEDLDWKDTVRAVREAGPLSFLRAARNDLSHRGFDTAKLDEVIAEAEAFLLAPQGESPRRDERR
ncbi:MAG: hypothetical protein QXD04_03305 [Candidatus Bathyarchaeia archaeon]